MIALIIASILGTWQYDGFTFEGHRYPPSDPALIVTFTFSDDGLSRLRWQRSDEAGFCERVAEFKVENETLYQKVIWLNPENKFDCAKDPDMVLGKETWVRYGVSNQ